MVLATIAASACGSTGDESTSASASAASTIATVTTAATTSPPPTTPTSTQPPPETSLPPTTSAPETTTTSGLVTGALPIEARYLIYGPDGIIALAATGEMTRLVTDPAAIAIGIGDALIIWQAGRDDGSLRLPREGPIRVLEPTGERTLPSQPDERVFLHDVGVVDGRHVIVATSIIGGGWESEEHLMLIDVATFERTDLGAVGYYEAGVEQAKFAGDRIIIKPFGQGYLIEAVDLNGEVVWVVDGPDDFENPGQVVVAGDRLLVTNPGFEGEDFAPVLEITEYAISSGEQVSYERLALDAAFGGGFCQIPEWDGDRLVCEESYGGPFTLDIGSGTASPLTSLERGMVSTIRLRTP